MHGGRIVLGLVLAVAFAGSARAGSEPYRFEHREHRIEHFPHGSALHAGFERGEAGPAPSTDLYIQPEVYGVPWGPLPPQGPAPHERHPRSPHRHERPR
jgi:hypothetical protein